MLNSIFFPTMRRFHSTSKALSKGINQIKEESLINSAFRKHVFTPVTVLTSGLSDLTNNWTVTFNLWLEYKRTAEKISSRVNIRHIMRAKRDLLFTIPTAIYAIVPFTIATLPYILRSFPLAIPSVFLADEILDKKMAIINAKRNALNKQIINSFNTQILAVAEANKDNAELSYCVNYWKNLLSTFESSPTKLEMLDLFPLLPLFKMGAGLAHMPSNDIILWSKYIGHSLPWILPRSRMYKWADWIIKDDQLIKDDGVNSLSRVELLEALEERGNSEQLINPSHHAQRRYLADHYNFTISAIKQTEASAASNSTVTAPKKAKKKFSVADMTTVETTRTKQKSKPVVTEQVEEHETKDIPVKKPTDPRDISAIAGLLILGRALGI